MAEIETTGTPRGDDSVVAWLTRRLAHYVQLPPEQIDPNMSITSYGLDSVYAFALCGEIENVLGVPLEPEQLWELDTVAALTSDLMTRRARANGPRPT
jgi:acyl carrier protein